MSLRLRRTLIRRQSCSSSIGSNEEVAAGAPLLRSYSPDHSQQPAPHASSSSLSRSLTARRLTQPSVSVPPGAASGVDDDARHQLLQQAICKLRLLNVFLVFAFTLLPFNLFFYIPTDSPLLIFTASFCNAHNVRYRTLVMNG